MKFVKFINKFLVNPSVLILASTGTSAQYNTDCTRDYFGNISCQTRPSDMGFIDFGALQRGAQQANQERQQQELMWQQLQIQQQMLDQQNQIRLQQERLNEIHDERNAPEWQRGGFVRREEGKRADGKSRCVFQSLDGFVFVKGKRYQSFFSLVAPEDQCPLYLSISKFTGDSK
jgi:hypothetical protein